MKVSAVLIEVTFEGGLTFQIDLNRAIAIDPENVLQTVRPGDERSQYGAVEALHERLLHLIHFIGQTVRERAEANLRRTGPIPGTKT